MYDDPRVAVGAGRFDGVGARAEAESKCKAIRHGVKSFAQASGAQRTVGELCAAAVAGRTRAAEGINRHVIFRR